MNLIKTELEGVCIIEPNVFQDKRGVFFESYSELTFPIPNVKFVQDNQSLSIYSGTIRGIHFQNGIYAQAKLVRCISGALYDYVVDLRKDSSTFKKWIRVELSAENKKMLFVPRGFGHLVITTKDNTEIFYKVDNFYSKENEKIINYEDPEINLDINIKEPILSDKDREAPYLKDCKYNF